MDSANREFAVNSRGEPKLSAQVKAPGFWPTIRASDGAHGGPNQRDSAGRPALAGAVRLWPTAKANCSTGAGKHGEGGADLQTAVKMWSTPAANDAKNATFPPAAINWDSLPGDILRQSMWPTPRGGEQGVGLCGGTGHYEMLKAKLTAEEVRQMSAGNGGQLNPSWVEQLMGFPVGWTDLDCDEPEATPFPAPLGCDQYPWEQPRVATGIKGRTNRLKALGNAVVPQIPFIIGSCIMEIEGGDNS